MSEQPLIINYGIPSKSTHSGGLRRFTALLTSAAETGAVGKKKKKKKKKKNMW
jgi:hypothetical protein